VPRGAEARAGDVLLRAGTRIGAAEIAVAANCGCAELAVYAKPMVAIVATGDELVEVRETPGPFQIRNSNSYTIAAMVAAAGGAPGRLEIARDVRTEIRERIAQGRVWDLMVLSGGVSMGEYDLVEEVLAEFGAEFLFTGVRMQPGKPVVFGRLPVSGTERECYFFGLPGNPVSTEVTFHCFVETFVRALAGEDSAEPRWALAKLAEDVAAKAGLTRLLPARMTGVEVAVVPWQGSGDVAANARANCYVELLPGRAYAAGEMARVLLR
jgi:molybdopterin molybdotransferase